MDIPKFPKYLEPLRDLCEKHGVGFRYRKSSRSQRRLKSIEGTQVNFWTFDGASVVLTGIDDVPEEAWHEVATKASRVCTGGWTTC